MQNVIAPKRDLQSADVVHVAEHKPTVGTSEPSQLRPPAQSEGLLHTEPYAGSTPWLDVDAAPLAPPPLLHAAARQMQKQEQRTKLTKRFMGDLRRESVFPLFVRYIGRTAEAVARKRSRLRKKSEPARFPADTRRAPGPPAYFTSAARPASSIAALVTKTAIEPAMSTCGARSIAATP